jgi:hypothetical protein
VRWRGPPGEAVPEAAGGASHGAPKAVVASAKAHPTLDRVVAVSNQVVIGEAAEALAARRWEQAVVMA